ncbi:MAG: discoidin domain-containing protein, partial [Phycisphaerae bacterium]|nr:discoidin domain-containing protein [Phycisphaerae bacterium]
MWNRLLKPMVFWLSIACLTGAPAWAVTECKISSYGVGHQIWFEVEDFDERDPADDSSFQLSDEPGAFGRSINSVNSSDGNGMIRYTFDIGKAGGSGGPWYFWGRVINPSNNSDFMLVAGHPGDPVPFTQPVGGLVNDQRVFEESLGSLPDGWAWSGDNHNEAHTKTLQDGENTMYIISREAGARWDVFMWTDDPDYVPTDEDYLNAKAPVAGTASKPSPAGGAVDVPRDAMLNWAPGEFAVTHQVYFGTSLEEVTAAGSGSALLIGKDLTTNHLALDRLDFGQTYYWRVDEVNGAPEYTVVKGNVWSFEVEPLAVQVENVTVTASSSDTNKDPNSTIDGSGLDAETGFHSTLETAQWTSALTQDPGTPVFLQYDFERPYKLHEVKIWNSNLTVENVLGFGFKDTIITYSADGVEWTRLGGDEGLVQLARGPGNDSCVGQTVPLDIVARSVKLTAVSNYSQYFKQYGLSEVQFYAIPTHARTPNPASGTQGVDPRST